MSALMAYLATVLPVAGVRAAVEPETVEVSGWMVGAPLAVLLLTVAAIEIGAAWLRRVDRETERIIRDRD